MVRFDGDGQERSHSGIVISPISMLLYQQIFFHLWQHDFLLCQLYMAAIGGSSFFSGSAI
jgi:hypothetical protein